MGVPGDKIFFLISTLCTDSENIYIDYKFNGPISAQQPFNHFSVNLVLDFANLSVWLIFSQNQGIEYNLN
jgi:hypothetical protein